METFASIFGHDPVCAANHTGLTEGMYWAEKRLTGINVVLYNLLTRMHNRGRYTGEVPGDRYYWGDICRDRIKYYRNFVFQGINTLKLCPLMPYHDPLRPLVRNWFASSNGVDSRRFTQCISEKNQDRLEEEGGACIMYTHFAFGFMRRRPPRTAVPRADGAAGQERRLVRTRSHALGSPRGRPRPNRSYRCPAGTAGA